MKKIKNIVISLISLIMINIFLITNVYAYNFTSEQDVVNFFNNLEMIKPDDPIDSFLFGNNEVYFYDSRNRSVNPDTILTTTFYFWRMDGDGFGKFVQQVGAIYGLTKWINETDIEKIKELYKDNTDKIKLANETIKNFSRCVTNNMNGNQEGLKDFIRNLALIYGGGNEATTIVNNFLNYNNKAAKKLTAIIENKKPEDIGDLITAEKIISVTGKDLNEETKDLDLAIGGIYELPDRKSSVTGKNNVDNIVSSADSFINQPNDNSVNTIKTRDIKDLSDTIYNILFIAGIIIAVIIGAIIGIKYIVGSLEEKANLKEVLIPYLVGCALVFGAFGIWKLVVTIFANM